MNKLHIAIAFVVGVILTVLAYSLFAPQAVGTSDPGSTFNTARTAAVAVTPLAAGANGTSTSILNTDANDRLVTGVRAACTGVGTSRTPTAGSGLANLLLTIGTTSSANPTAIPAGFNKVGGLDYPLSTTTPNLALASSTAGVSSTTVVWAAGSYMTFNFNATNTAACTVGVDYLQS